jgi:hypothetical protein
MAILLFLNRLHLQSGCNDVVQSISLPGKVDSSLCVLLDVLQSRFYYVYYTRPPTHCWAILDCLRKRKLPLQAGGTHTGELSGLG